MSYRAAIILQEKDKIALIERFRQGAHYFTFPGGHIEEGETPSQAAVRETFEELGLHVRPGRLVARMRWQGNWQYYYLAEIIGGRFGTGQGEEMGSSLPGQGSYHPVWMPVSEIPDQPVMPPEIASLVVCWFRDGWPGRPVVIPGIRD